MTLEHHKRVLVIGAGRGGTAMLELFLSNPLVEIVGIIDANPNAPALAIAAEYGIRVFANIAEAIEDSRPCLAFNLTGDDSVTAFAETQLGSVNVIGGFQAHFIWNLLTRLKQSSEQVTHLAHHDGLTALPNRILFYDRLNQAIARSRREKESFAVLFLDLDGFKAINDMYGHDVGDALLRETARRLVACVRESDTVARLGGDEFTVILSNAKERSSIERVVGGLVESIAQPFILDGRNCSVSVSIGIALYPENAGTAEQLVKQADAAMYMAKQGGKNSYRFVGG